MREDAGKPGYLIQVQDITDRKRAEDLRQSEKKFRLITEAIIDVVAATLDEYRDAFARKGTGRIKHRYRHPERGYIWVESRGFVTEINGERTGVIVTRDITDRKKAEDALIESEMRVREKLDALMEPEGDISSLELADITRAYSNKANSYLVKPVDFDQFVKLMEILGYYWIAWNERPY